ncbi:MAG TPA: hypothetical protein DCR21_06485 [Succinivibrionaceae bacterium]|nr:hypothetical protein [Succinivibrionaceae bacterium]
MLFFADISLKEKENLIGTFYRKRKIQVIKREPVISSMATVYRLSVSSLMQLIKLKPYQQQS